MSRSTPRVRRLLGAAATTCIAAGAMVGLASTADAAKPVATATATVTYDSARVDVSVARGVTQIRTATCTLDGAAVACGSPSADGKKAATYSVTLADLAAGIHTFAISIRLTDGGVVTATTSFVSTAPVSARQAACEGIGGSFLEGISWWECHIFSESDEVDETAILAAIQPVCDTIVDGVSVQDDGDAWDAVTLCRYPSTDQAQAACGASGTGGAFSAELEFWACLKGAVEDGLFEQLSPLCSEVDGLLTLEPFGDAAWMYRCEAAA